MTLIEEIKQLPVSQRLKLVEDVWDSIADESAKAPLTQAQRDELEWRIAHPSESTFTFEEVQSRARANKRR